MKLTETDMIMEDGTTYWAEDGMIGLSPKDEITVGCDGHLTLAGDHLAPIDDDVAPIAHRIEIATYMIARWTRYLAALEERRAP